MFKSPHGNIWDYHNSVNSTSFTEWFEKQLPPNIPLHALLIMGNASYHSKIISKAPVQSSKRMT